MGHEKLLINTASLQDVDEQANMLPDWVQEYQQLGCGKFEGTLAVAQIQQFALIRETSNQALHENIVPPSDQLVVGMSLVNEKSSTCNGVLFDQNSILMVHGGRHYDIKTEGYMELVGISVSRDFFYSKVNEQDAYIAQDAIGAGVLQLDPRAATMLRQYFIMVSGILQDGDGAWPQILTPRMLASTAISNIALAVNMSNPDQYMDFVPKSHKRRIHIVQHAIEHMRNNIGEEIGILDVCAATNVSRRTLQYCFEEYLKISPLQYLKALRLNTARRQLKYLDELQLSRENINTIANVAALCGFNHASRFASDYKHMFGELPSQVKTTSKAAINPGN